MKPSAWSLSDRFDPAGALMADRHYSRQKVGTPQFVPPGACLVLRRPAALWVTSWPLPEFTQHEWAGAWVCSIFRREPEDPALASDLIRSAVAATRHKWPLVPDLGMVTFIDETAVRRKRDPGRCFRRAGFRPVGYTKKRHYLALQLLLADMPDADAAEHAQLDMFAGAS